MYKVSRALYFMGRTAAVAAATLVCIALHLQDGCVPAYVVACSVTDEGIASLFR